jgi:hypothetical protein
VALNLRKSIFRNSGVNAVVCFVLSAGLGMLTGARLSDPSGLVWLLLLALGIGAFSGWRTMMRIKRGTLNAIPKSISQLRIERDMKINGTAIDWQTLDDYAIQLETRGFARLGDFTPWPLPKQFIGVAACFADAAGTTIIEVQHIQGHRPNNPKVGRSLDGVHFSISSMVGGCIRVVTSDHTIKATNYLIRGENDVVASYPGMGLLPLLDKHARLLAAVAERSGKTVTIGLNMERYILLQRERFAQARTRIERMSGLEIARQIDAFEADPKSQWAPPAALLAGLPERPLDALDKGAGAQGQPLILVPASANAASIAKAETSNGTENAASASVTIPPEADAEAAALRQRAASAANWFYWIAGLSLVNAIVGALGSKWAFAIGLGISEISSGVATGMRASAGSSPAVIALLYAISFAAAAFFAVCGRYAHRPSAAAFGIGMMVFALDTAIFLVAGDWIGVAFHALALFYLWNGLSAARRLKVAK